MLIKTALNGGNTQWSVAIKVTLRKTMLSNDEPVLSAEKTMLSADMNNAQRRDKQRSEMTKSFGTTQCWTAGCSSGQRSEYVR